MGGEFRPIDPGVNVLERKQAEGEASDLVAPTVAPWLQLSQPLLGLFDPLLGTALADGGKL
jgi:hypothetical protein